MSSRTVTVVLHGNLRALHPGEIRINGATCSEIISGLLRMIPTLKPRADRERKLVQVQGFTTEESFHLPIEQDEIHVVPAMTGGKSGGFFKILLGVVLIGAGLFLGPGVAAFGVQIGGIGGFLFNAGVSLLLGGILEFLSPQPKFDSGGQTDGSLYFGSTQNTTRIGTRIALLYGRMKVYGHLLSYNIDATIDSLQIPPKSDTGGGTSGTPGVPKPRKKRAKGISHGTSTALGVAQTDFPFGGGSFGGSTDVGAAVLGYIAVATGGGSSMGGVAIYDSDNSYTPLTFNQATGEDTRGLAFSPNNREMYFGTWEVGGSPAGQSFWGFKTEDFTEVTYADIDTNAKTTDHEQLAVSSSFIASIVGTDCFIFNRSDKTLLATIAIGEYGYSCDFSPDETMLAIGCYNGSVAIQIYETTAWTVIQTIGDASKAVLDVKWSPDQTYLASIQMTNTANTDKTTGNIVNVYNVSDWSNAYHWDSVDYDPPRQGGGTPIVGNDEFLYFKAHNMAWLAWRPDSSMLACAFDNSYKSQTNVGGPDGQGNDFDHSHWSSIFYITVGSPSFSFQYVFGDYTDHATTFWTKRDYEWLAGPCCWSKDGTICYFNNYDTAEIMALDASGSKVSGLALDYGGGYPDLIKVTT